MPCNDHSVKSQDGCVACFTADALDLVTKLMEKKPDWSELQVARSTINERYKALKESDQKSEVTWSIVRDLNRGLSVQKIGLVGAAAIQPWQIDDEHRDLYRARIRTMGTWIGLTELHRLGVTFKVQFSIAYQAGAYWNTISVGEMTDPAVVISAPVLRWNGVHYDLAVLSLGVNKVVQSTVATNPLGDCAFESFLLMVLRSSSLNRMLGEPFRDEKLAIISAFRAAYERTQRGRLIRSTDGDYLTAIRLLRDLLAKPEVLSNAFVDRAIIAEGVLPVDPSKKVEEESSSEGEIVLKEAPKLVALLKDLSEKLEETLMKHALDGVDPSKVVGYVGRALVGPASKDSHDFAMTDCGHEDACEHSVSKGDGEVLLLNAILDDVLEAGNDEVEVILCGPYGPCNGCKERIAKFVKLWQAASKKGQTLIVHYLYCRVADKTRGDDRIQTTYGDRGDQQVQRRYGKDGYIRLHTWGPVSGSK